MPAPAGGDAGSEVSEQERREREEKRIAEAEELRAGGSYHCSCLGPSS